MEKDLVKFVDNFSKAVGLQMTVKEYSEWLEDSRQFQSEKPGNNRGWSKEEKKTRAKRMEYIVFTREKYRKVHELAKEEWLLKTDGIVKALRYKAEDKTFVAKVVYEKGGYVMNQLLIVPDDWVIDTYGKELTNKLMDRAEHHEYIQAVNDEDATLTVLKLDERKIIRVKYIPTTYVHRTDEWGKDITTKEVCTPAHWKGMLEDGRIYPLLEDSVREHFASRFVDECKKLGNKKFVQIPVGSCRSSVITLIPTLRCQQAPPINFMQGNEDTCVYSSLASAFDKTAIPDLMRVAKILNEKSSKLSGGVNCLRMVKDIVAQNVKWLQPKRLRKTFNWENDMNDYMFVVGVIMDSTNSCQHAVTIFRNWIYDSNEPYALPLRQESLDCCTWDIKDGVIHEASSFVRFIDGWSFTVLARKKMQLFDRVIAPAMNVKQAESDSVT
jgi:hypothetical protein